MREISSVFVNKDPNLMNLKEKSKFKFSNNDSI
ncbi:MAG: hypothetical protein ACNI3H_12155 [Halarcobacter ebronensis]